MSLNPALCQCFVNVILQRTLQLSSSSHNVCTLILLPCLERRASVSGSRDKSKTLLSTDRDRIVNYIHTITMFWTSSQSHLRLEHSSSCNSFKMLWRRSPSDVGRDGRIARGGMVFRWNRLMSGQSLPPSFHNGQLLTRCGGSASRRRP
jgi:hypothetical protein